MSELQRITDIRHSAERAADAGYDVEANPYSATVNQSEHQLWRHYFFTRQTHNEQREAA